MADQALYRVRARHSQQAGEREFVVARRTARAGKANAWLPIKVCQSRDEAQACLDALLADGPLYPPIHDPEWFRYLTRQFNVSLAWRLIKPGRQMRSLDVATAAPSLVEEEIWETLPDGRKRMRGSVFKQSFEARVADDPRYDLSIPLLAVEMVASDWTGAGSLHVTSPQYEPVRVIIDGYHRLFKAWKKGVPTLNVFVLDRDEALSVSQPCRW